ncbi:MAG: SCP2 sterol-binding domain-containing protein [Pseudomonadota bacterium]
MSDVIDQAVEALKEKLGDEKVDASAKFHIEDEGSIVIDGDGVRAADDDTEVTLTADVDTFRGILDGEVNATTAYMTGRLKVAGDMGAAMKLASLLA